MPVSKFMSLYPLLFCWAGYTKLEVLQAKRRVNIHPFKERKQV